MCYLLMSCWYHSKRVGIPRLFLNIAKKITVWTGDSPHTFVSTPSFFFSTRSGFFLSWHLFFRQPIRELLNNSSLKPCIKCSCFGIQFSLCISISSIVHWILLTLKQWIFLFSMCVHFHSLFQKKIVLLVNSNFRGT